MELKCNNIKCRKTLSTYGKACVTSCSHIFCMDCSNSYFPSALVCPACDSPLSEAEDIVCADLNPTEEYKSSILAGLRPETILEIASRAIAFWVYQSSQESFFQEMLYKNLDEKYVQLHKLQASQSVIHNQEISSFKDKIQVMSKEHEQDKRKMQDLSEQYLEKSRQLQKLQNMYDKLKRKSFSLNAAPGVPSTPQISHHNLNAAQFAKNQSPSLHYNNGKMFSSANGAINLRSPNQMPGKIIDGTSSNSIKFFSQHRKSPVSAVYGSKLQTNRPFTPSFS